MPRKTKAKTTRVEGMTWVGDGTEMIPGVPPRNLTPEEAERFRDLIVAVQDNTGRALYEMGQAPDTEDDPDPTPSPDEDVVPDQTPEPGEDKE